MTSSNETFNADELVAPDWLNNEFFTEVLAKYLNESNLKVRGITLSPASAKGDHYASVMFRAGVEYSTDGGKFTKSLIIKTMPETEGMKKDLLAEAHIFPTEIAMYTKVLPKFEAILRDVGDETKFFAKCVYHSLEPRQVMIFEDLVSAGYSVIRKRSTTVEELKSALERLGKWHAVSYKLLQEEPELFKGLEYDITTLPNFIEQDFVTTALPTFMDMLDTVESLKKYRKYFEPLRDHLTQSWVDIIREYRDNRQENGYYVLCHGDFHARNMMFKGSECMLLDFQMCYIGSMTNDIIYAIYMLFGSGDRKDKCDELIYHYFESFTETLNKLNYEGRRPTLIEFREQLLAKRYNHLFLLTTFLPGIISMLRGEDPADIIESVERRTQMYYDKEFVDQLEFILPRMLHLGYLEE